MSYKSKPRRTDVRSAACCQSAQGWLLPAADRVRLTGIGIKTTGGGPRPSKTMMFADLAPLFASSQIENPAGLPGHVSNYVPGARRQFPEDFSPRSVNFVLSPERSALRSGDQVRLRPFPSLRRPSQPLGSGHCDPRRRRPRWVGFGPSAFRRLDGKTRHSAHGRPWPNPERPLRSKQRPQADVRL